MNDNVIGMFIIFFSNFTFFGAVVNTISIFKMHFIANGSFFRKQGKAM